MLTRHVVACSLAALILSAASFSASAADTPDTTSAPATLPAPITGAQQAAFIKPYLTADTLFVIHADAAYIDTGAIEKIIDDAMASLPKPDADAPKKIATARLVADAFLARFKQLGGRQVYWIMSQRNNGRPDALVLVPLEPGGDSKMLSVLLSTVPGAGPPAVINDNLIAIGKPESDAAETVKALVPLDRPDLEQALAAGSGSVQIAFSFSPAMRAKIAREAPMFPKDLGGGSTDIFSKNMQYVTLSLALPPAADFSGVLQSDSPENAKATADFLNQYIDYTGKQMEKFANTTDNPFAIFAPVAQGSTVTSHIDGAHMQAAALAIIKPMLLMQNMNNGNRARRGGSNTATYIKQDLLGIQMYAADNNNAWPADLHAIVDKGYLPDDKSLTNPRDPKKRPFEYHAWTPDELKTLPPATTPAIWEVVDDPQESINVGYVDGHVEMLPNKKALDAQLDAARAVLKQP